MRCLVNTRCCLLVPYNIAEFAYAARWNLCDNNDCMKMNVVTNQHEIPRASTNSSSNTKVCEVQIAGKDTVASTSTPNASSDANYFRSKSIYSRSESRQPERVTGRLQLGSSSSISSNRRSCNRRTSSASCDDSEIYLTQYSIDHSQQSDGLCEEVLLEECLPCCDGRKRRKHCNSWTVVWWLAWAVISSELFLYLLHMTSIIIGALNEVLGLRGDDPTLSLINSCVETSATLLLLIIRMTNAYGGYRQVRQTVRHEENFNPDKDIHVLLLKRWMFVFELIGLILFGFSLGCFLIFYYHLHLGWTILSNNLCMITILVVSTLYRSRVVIVISRVREDQHKVVIYEAALIIEQASVNRSQKNVPSGATDESKETDKPQHKFVRAVQSTKLFDKPTYIDLVNAI